MAISKKIIKAIKSFIRRRMPFIDVAYMVRNGEKELKRIRSIYGDDTHVFLMRGATGDTYIQLALIDNRIREHGISSYRIVGDSAGCIELTELFQEQNFVFIDAYKVACIEKAHMLLGSERLNLTILFPWTYSLYFNRCRVRMTERFHFMDTYRYYVLGLKEDMQIKVPDFRPLTPARQTELSEIGAVRGKTVLIAPEANSVTQLEADLWNKVIEGLRQKGYAVIVNIKKNGAYRAPSYFCTYAESVPLLEYAGFFIGLRSGFCDIVSSAKCQKVIVYPARTRTVNYSEHRTEIEFCGLKVMGLIDKNDATLTEIDTTLVRNITAPGSGIQNKNEQEHEERELINKILNCFQNV